MKTQRLEIPDILLVEVPIFGDSRGFFSERFKKDLCKNQGIEADFIQDNYSRSEYGVIRGLHFQYDQPQAKLVTCTRGSIVDVVVDIRKNSKTYGKSLTVSLSGDSPQWLWVPAGFAHGFAVTSKEGADLWYKVDANYNPKGEGSIAWNDPILKVQWPAELAGIASLSGRDQQAPSFEEYNKNPRFF